MEWVGTRVGGSFGHQRGGGQDLEAASIGGGPEEFGVVTGLGAEGF